MVPAPVAFAASVEPAATDDIAPRWSASDSGVAIAPDAGAAPPASPLAETVAPDASPGGAEGD